MANVFDQVSSTAPERVWGYVGFWWRVLAWAIDSLILSAADLLLQAAAGQGQPWSGDMAQHRGGLLHVSDLVVTHSWTLPPPNWLDLMLFVTQAGYFALLESSRWQATLGKRLCRLRVTDLHGDRISLPRPIGRYFAKFLSALIVCIGFLMVGWTRRKQGLHDILAETLVVRLQPPRDLVRFNPPLVS